MALYSTNLGLTLITTGDEAGQWGNTTNTNLGTYLEQAITGYQTQAITDGADTVITIPDGSSGTARNMYLELTGALTAVRNLIVPAKRKLYFIYNNTTGGFAVTVKVSGLTGVSVPNGAKVLLVCNGTDIVSAMTYLTTLTVGGATTLSSNVTIAAPASGIALDVGAGASGSYSIRTGGPVKFSGAATVGATEVSVINYESGSAATRLYIGDGTGYSFRFAKRVTSTTTDLVTITDAGNVTINTPASGFALVVNGQSGANIASFQSAATSDAGIIFGITSSQQWNLRVTYSDGSFRLYDQTRVAYPLIVSNAGNVTIAPPSSGVALAVTGVTANNVANFLGGASNSVVSLQSTAAASVGVGIEAKNSVQTWQFGLGVGVGTSSWYLHDATRSAQPLTVTTSGNVTIAAPSSGVAFTASAASGGIAAILNANASFALQIASPATNFAGIQFAQSGQTTCAIYNAASTGDFRLQTNSVDRISITSAGNVTIAAPSSGTALQVYNKGGVESGVNVTAPAATQNIAFSANGSTTAAALVQLTNATGITYLGSESSAGGSLATGTSAYSTVISTGTAAVSIQLATNNTVRQTITNAGNVGIGTTSPAARLQSAIDVTDSNVGQILASGVTDTNKRLSMGFHTTSNYGFIQALIAGTNTYDLVLQPNGSNLGLGVTPSAWTYGAKALQIKSYSALFESNAGQTTLSFNARESAANVYSYLQTEYAAMYRQVSGVHYWLNAPSGTAGNTITFTQAMTLDANSKLLLLQTVPGLVNSNSLSLEPSNGYAVWNHVNGTASGTKYFYFGYNAFEIGSITQSGTAAVLYNVTSDHRLKTNITDADSASALIDAIQVRKFDWISDYSHQRYGMIAQELHEIYPEAVHTPTDPTEMMGVDYSKLVPLLVKEVQSLRSRVHALELA